MLSKRLSHTVCSGNATLLVNVYSIVNSTFISSPHEVSELSPILAAVCYCNCQRLNNHKAFCSKKPKKTQPVTTGDTWFILNKLAMLDTTATSTVYATSNKWFAILANKEIYAAGTFFSFFEIMVQFGMHWCHKTKFIYYRQLESLHSSNQRIVYQALVADSMSMARIIKWPQLTQCWKPISLSLTAVFSSTVIEGIK